MHNRDLDFTTATDIVLSRLTDQSSNAKCALVPIKALANAKQRLMPALNQNQRQQLSRAMAHDVLSTLSSIPNLALTVCAGDDYGVQLARTFNAALIADAELPHPGLDAIASMFTQRVAKQGYSHAMIVHADIPLLSTETLETIFDAEANSDVALVADRHKRGTNVLRWRIASGFFTKFGVNSRAHHLDECATLNLHLSEINCDDTALDIDCPDDLRLLRQSERLIKGTHTHAFFEQMKAFESAPIAGETVSASVNV